MWHHTSSRTADGFRAYLYLLLHFVHLLRCWGPKGPERRGFEPLARIFARIDLANQHFKPLSHLSFPEMAPVPALPALAPGPRLLSSRDDRIRTYDTRYQKPLPYLLATSQTFPSSLSGPGAKVCVQHTGEAGEAGLGTRSMRKRGLPCVCVLGHKQKLRNLAWARLACVGETQARQSLARRDRSARRPE